ncbi:MAG: helicase UvrD [Ferruginibacter sp.]|nr:helicase UvrD [Ferruginibacter sp.]
MIISAYEFESIADEYDLLAARCSTIFMEDILSGDFMIVCENEQRVQQLASHFFNKNIPVFHDHLIDCNNLAFSGKLLRLLRYIEQEQHFPGSGDALLYELLHYDFFAVPHEAILQLTVNWSRQRYSVQSVSLRRLLAIEAGQPAKDLFDPELHIALKKVSALLENAGAASPQSSLDIFIENFFSELTVSSSLQQNTIRCIVDFCRQELKKDPGLKLTEVTGRLASALQEQHPLLRQLVPANPSGIRIASIDNFGKDCPEQLVLASVSNQETLDKMLSSFQSAKHKSVQLHLLKPFTTRDLGRRFDVGNEIATTTFPPNLPVISLPPADFLSPILSKFVMSVSALNCFLDCPLGFYFQYILRVPFAKSDALLFGSSIHDALEKLFRAMQEGGKEAFPPADFLLQTFEQSMLQQRANFTKEGWQTRLHYGIDVLQQYYDRNVSGWNKVVAIERNIRAAVSGVPIKGKLDKLEFNGKEINVVDYKSGNVEKALLKMRGPNEDDPDGGAYWRQAVFYKILIDHYQQKEWRVVSTEFDFIEPDQQRQYRKEKLLISPADTETVKQQIISSWYKIQQHEFHTGCGKSGCYWCGFVRENFPPQR